MMPANAPFQVDGPPYPRDLPFYQTEALSWLFNDKDGHVLASFRTAEEAVQAVKRLYNAGATRVDVVVTRVDLKEARDYAEELDVTFPKESAHEIVSVIRSLHPENWETDLEEGETIDSRYAEYEREVRADLHSSQTCIISWD